MFSQSQLPCPPNLTNTQPHLSHTATSTLQVTHQTTVICWQMGCSDSADFCGLQNQKLRETLILLSLSMASACGV